jgi:hypothetical protein
MSNANSNEDADFSEQLGMDIFELDCALHHLNDDVAPAWLRIARGLSPAIAICLSFSWNHLELWVFATLFLVVLACLLSGIQLIHASRQQANLIKVVSLLAKRRI